MEERVSFDWVTNERIKISKVEYDPTKLSGSPSSKYGWQGWVDWRVKLDSRKGNIQDQLLSWENEAVEALLSSAPRGGFALGCSNWLILSKIEQTEYDTCCSILLNVRSTDPNVDIWLRGDGTEPCSV